MKYNDQGIINLMGAIIEQAENDIKKPWGVSGYSIAEDTRNALDAIRFFPPTGIRNCQWEVTYTY